MQFKLKPVFTPASLLLCLLLTVSTFSMTACDDDMRTANTAGFCEDYAKKDGADVRGSILEACARGVEIYKGLSSISERVAECDKRYSPASLPEMSGTDENALIDYSIAASKYSDLLMACYNGANIQLDLVTGLPVETDPEYSCVVTVGGSIGDCQ